MIGFTDLVKCVIVLADKPCKAAVCVFTEHNVKTFLYKARGPVQNKLQQAEISEFPP